MISEQYGYHEALLGLGLHPLEAPASDDEVPYQDDDQHLYLEVHMSPFPPDSEAYGDCNQFFADALSRTIRVQVEVVSLRTPEETDHLLYLICHAYKHFLHSGVGIRQICDMAIFVRAYGDRINWQRVLTDCRTIRIERFAAALFRIADRYLGYPMPEVFAEINVDEEPLLEDILSGGLQKRRRAPLCLSPGEKSGGQVRLFENQALAAAGGLDPAGVVVRHKTPEGESRRERPHRPGPDPAAEAVWYHLITQYFLRSQAAIPKKSLQQREICPLRPLFLPGGVHRNPYAQSTHEIPQPVARSALPWRCELAGGR